MAQPLPEIIDGKAVKSLAEARAIRHVVILGRPGGWAVLVRYGAEERTVAAQRSRHPRLWRNLNTAAAFVRDELGLPRFEVDTAEYDPEANPRKRPDQAERLQRQREAAAYDRWFRAQVEEALREADDPAVEWLPHEVVKEDVARQRAALQARIKGSAK